MSTLRPTTVKQTQASITSYGKSRKRQSPAAAEATEIQEMNKLISKQKGATSTFKEMVSKSSKSKSAVTFSEPSSIYPALPQEDPASDVANESDFGQMSDSQSGVLSDN